MVSALLAEKDAADRSFEDELSACAQIYETVTKLLAAYAEEVT